MALATLAGVVVGTILGATASIGLLILAQDDPVWSRWKDPLGLWADTPDAMIRAGAGLVGIGFLMIGISLFMGVGSSRRR